MNSKSRQNSPNKTLHRLTTAPPNRVGKKEIKTAKLNVLLTHTQKRRRLAADLYYPSLTQTNPKLRPIKKLYRRKPTTAAQWWICLHKRNYSTPGCWENGLNLNVNPLGGGGVSGAEIKLIRDASAAMLCGLAQHAKGAHGLFCPSLAPTCKCRNFYATEKQTMQAVIRFDRCVTRLHVCMQMKTIMVALTRRRKKRGGSICGPIMRV